MTTNKERQAVDAILGKKVPIKLVETVAAIAKGEKKYEEPNERVLPLLFNFNEAARRLGVSRSRFWELRKQGVVPTVLVDGTTYVRSEDLERLVAELSAHTCEEGGGNE